jgi:hypothetical protein
MNGICVPVVVVLLDFAIGTSIEGSTVRHIGLVVAEEIGIGLLVGLTLTGGAFAVLRFAFRIGWTSEHWLHIPVIALAALCFTAAQALGGSGFIACFTGGLFGFLQSSRDPDLLSGASSTGEVLALLTWVVFGGPVLERLLPQMTWQDAALCCAQSDRDPHATGVPLACGECAGRPHEAVDRVVRPTRACQHRFRRHCLRRWPPWSNHGGSDRCLHRPAQRRRARHDSEPARHCTSTSQRSIRQIDVTRRRSLSCVNSKPFVMSSTANLRLALHPQKLATSQHPEAVYPAGSGLDRAEL